LFNILSDRASAAVLTVRGLLALPLECYVAASVYTSCDTLLSALKKVYTHACTHSHRHMYSVQQ